MSRYVTFDLDELGSTKFQELCNSLLLKHFSPLIHCMVRPGRDGQCDGRLNGLPVNYSDLINRPFKYKVDGKGVIWFFQAKHTQKEDGLDRQKAVLSAFKKEISDWKKKVLEERPTHYILLTNVNLMESTAKQIQSSGDEFFVHFEIWHEPKISCFINGDEALQKTFYPHRSTSLNLITEDALKQVLTSVNVEKNMLTVSQSERNTVRNIEEFIKILVEYEINFQKINDSFARNLKIFTQTEDPPEEWIIYEYVSKEEGILILSEKITELQKLANKVARNEIQVTKWNRHLGEEICKGEIIIAFACDPEIELQLETLLGSVFNYMPIESLAYSEVDKNLRQLESKILNDIKNFKIQDAHDGLQQMYRLRETYSLFKADYSNVFYPNVRTFGGKPVIGWDFISLWENIFRNIYDMAFEGKIPEFLTESLLSIPFVLCGEAIRKRRNNKSYQTELDTLRIPLRTIIKKDDTYLLELYFDKLENLALELSNLDYHIESLDQAEWAFGIIIETSKFIANLGWMLLSGKIPQLSFDYLNKCLSLITSLSFNSLLSRKNLVSDIYLKQKNLKSEIILIRKECLFAWATFEWFQQRLNCTFDPKLSLNFLKNLNIEDVVLFYNRNKFSKNGWINEWFIPSGKQVSWSWAIDHDIREILQLAILTLPIKPNNFSQLKELDDSGWYKQFILELEQLHKQLNSCIRDNFSLIVTILDEAHHQQKANLKQLIRSQSLSKEKLDVVDHDFQKNMSLKSKEGILYFIEDISKQENLKPSHAVGPYFIENKNYFIDQIGSVTYVYSDIGKICAEMLNSQRERLLVDLVRKIGVCKEYESNQLEEIINRICNSYQEDYLLLCSSQALGELYGLKVFQQRDSSVNAYLCRKIGQIDVLFLTVLEYGEILLVPKLGFVWFVENKTTKIKIDLINEESQLGIQIVEANPGIDLGEKVIVNGREKGTMLFQSSSPCEYFKLSDEVKYLDEISLYI
ncbi:MAG: hypothetical protein WC222_08225 [Parachlamydiales bacterium]|jgi:hypothetical protein